MVLTINRIVSFHTTGSSTAALPLVDAPVAMSEFGKVSAENGRLGHISIGIGQLTHKNYPPPLGVKLWAILEYPVEDQFGGPARDRPPPDPDRGRSWRNGDDTR